jgi:hypothetical protein
MDPEVFELRRMPRVPVKPSLENGMQVGLQLAHTMLLRMHNDCVCSRSALLALSSCCGSVEYTNAMCPVLQL